MTKTVHISTQVPASEKPILYEKFSNSIAKIVLNRPERSNAFSLELLKALAALLEKIRETPTIRVVLLTGNGSHFCGGLDLFEAKNAHDQSRELITFIAECLTRFRQLPQMTITAVHGAARGGGGGLVVASDFVIADNTFHLAFPEIHRGLDPILLFPLLRRRLSTSAISELILTGMPINVFRARELGLVQRITETGKAFEAAEEFSHKIIASAASPLRTAKELILAQETAAAGCSLEQEFSQSLENHLTSWQTPEAQEGVNAFLEKRSPYFF